jgi:hypothetical protein
MSDIYINKALKYKLKYLKLKMNFEGGTITRLEQIKDLLKEQEQAQQQLDNERRHENLFRVSSRMTKQSNQEKIRRKEYEDKINNMNDNDKIEAQQYYEYNEAIIKEEEEEEEKIFQEIENRNRILENNRSQILTIQLKLDAYNAVKEEMEEFNNEQKKYFEEKNKKKRIFQKDEQKKLAEIKQLELTKDERKKLELELELEQIRQKKAKLEKSLNDMENDTLQILQDYENTLQYYQEKIYEIIELARQTQPKIPNKSFNPDQKKIQRRD